MLLWGNLVTIVLDLNSIINRQSTYRYYIFEKVRLGMCQCVVADCCWWNVCGVCCAGYHWAFFLISCWLCKPLEMLNFDADCCKVCVWTGYGGNCFCHGALCCAPESVKAYSRMMNGQIASPNVIIINQTTPREPLVQNQQYPAGY